MSDKLKKCNACDKDIAKKAKKCVHCGGDQRNWFMRHKFITAIGAVIILGVLGTMGKEEAEPKKTGTVETTKKPENGGKTEEPVEKVYKVGDVITNDKVEIAIISAEVKNKVGGEYFEREASEGGIYVVVDYTVKNVTKEPIGMFEMPSMKLVDGEGVKYVNDLEASTSYTLEKGDDNGKVLSDLNPGITTKDSQVFEVSKELYEAGKWHLTIDNIKVQIKE